MSYPRTLVLAALCAVALPAAAQANGNVYVSRFWHNHQPIYWPEWNGNGSENSRVQYAWDSIVMKPGQNYGGISPAQHPENNLTDIFGLDDRRNSYQSGPRNSLTGFDSRGGFAISYSGSLIDNVRQLGGVGQLGYGGGWNNGYREARGWNTPSGSTRMDLVGFTYRLSLAPLLPKSVFRKELQTFKQAWWKAWGGNSDLSDHSKGFFPTEMGYSRHLIDVLVEEGYQWVIVGSHHISRTCPTYFDQFDIENGSYGIYSSPPNRADQLGPSPTSGWWYGEPNPGNAAWNVSPYAYQLHRVKYVDPETGAEKKMIAVPSDDVLSYRYGYANEGIGKIGDEIAPFATDPNRPVIVMPSTDGDNAWGGGSSSWFEATPQLFNESANAGYNPTTPQDFVNAHGAAAQDAHIEDGAWIFPESCYGSPNFLKWIEPPVVSVANRYATAYPGTQVDMETPGFALKFFSYAPLMAGANWLETAEQILSDENGGNDMVNEWKVAHPYNWDGSWTSPNDVELAWHIYLNGLDSGFNYYGGLGNDDEVKPALATKNAIDRLQGFMTPERKANDRTPPTVLKPQRFPWNPGAYTFGWFNSTPGDGNALKKMDSEFYIWTHAYDINGVSNIVVNVRIDADGVNTMANNQNETYAGGSDVGSWVSLPMTKRVLPVGAAALTAAANNGQIEYFDQALSPEVADYYFVRIDDSALSGFRDKLLDYYIEAEDGRGNVSKSDIQHVYVEDDGTEPEDPPGQPQNLVATALSGSQISLAWTAASNAASYVVKRDGSEVGTTAATNYTDSGLLPLTDYSYTVLARNGTGDSAESASASATTLVASAEFQMDGAADYAGYLVSNPGMTIYAAVRGSQLYVATWSPGDAGGLNDHFILVSDELLPSATAAAPWAKTGTIAVAESKPFLAAESAGSYAGWFNAPAGSGVSAADTSAGQLEGTIDLVAAFGAMPTNIYLAALAYQTEDAGVLGAQAPVGNGDGNVDPDEFMAFPVAALNDALFTGTFDRLDPARDFRILEAWSGSDPLLEWPCVPGRTYQPQYSTNLGGGWLPLGGSIPASSGQDALSVSNLIQRTNNACFFRIRLEN